MDRSSIIGSILVQQFNTKVDDYIMNGTTQDWLYFLVDRIYLKWSIFAQKLASLTISKEKYYKQEQEHIWKDIQKCFSILVKKSTIFDNLFNMWYLKDIQKLLQVCSILYNMTMKEQQSLYNFSALQSIKDQK